MQCGRAGFNSSISCKGPVVQEAWAASGLKQGHGTEPQGLQRSLVQGKAGEGRSLEVSAALALCPESGANSFGSF